jgi:integrase/recombinase XerC
MAPFFVLESFIKFLHVEKRFSEHTTIAYKKDIEQFFDFSEISKLEDLEDVNHHLVRSWIVALIDNGIENKSVNRKLSSLRSFYKWLRKENLTTVNPLVKIRGPKGSKRLPSFVKESELKEENLNQYFKDDFEGIQDRLILEFFYQTGIRLNELIQLKDSDIQNDSIKVLGKRNKERLIPISSVLKIRINEFKKMKHQQSLITPFFFSLKNGNKLYPKYVYRKIHLYLTLATSMEKRSPHMLRHTFATHMLNNGAGLETLKDILGHANLSATQIYTHNSFSKLTSIYSQAHPRGDKDKT